MHTTCTYKLLFHLQCSMVRNFTLLAILFPVYLYTDTCTCMYHVSYKLIVIILCTYMNIAPILTPPTTPLFPVVRIPARESGV